MTDDKKTDWSDVDKVIKKEQQEESPVVFEKRKLPTLEQKASDAMESVDGIITKIRAKQIERKAVIKWLHNWWDNQNDLAEEQMKTAVELRKKEMLVDSKYDRLSRNNRVHFFKLSMEIVFIL